MKKTFFSIATLFVAAAISVAVVSCQKDKEPENENQTVVKSSNDNAKELLNRIYAFQSLRDDINSGAKSGESMTLEELRDNIDLTFNYEHSQHATPFDYATLDTFYVKMPDVDANGNPTLPKDFINNKNAQSILYFGKDPTGLELRKANTFYTENINGVDAHRIIYNPAIIHPWSHFSYQSTVGTIEFFDKALDAPVDIAPTNQIWQWKVVANTAGLIGFFLFMVSLTLVLVKTPFFSDLSVETPVEPRAVSKAGKIWFFGALVLGTTFATLAYFPILTALKSSGGYNPGILQSSPNGVSTWAAACGLFGVISMVVSYFCFGKKNGVDLADVGVKISWKKLGKTIALAAIVIFFTISTVFVADYLFMADFRIWVLAVRAFKVDQLGYSLFPYGLLFLVYYVGNSVAVNCFNYNDIGVKNGKGKWINVLLVALSAVLPAIILLLMQYIPYFAGSDLMWPQNNMYGVWLFPMLVILPGAAVVSRIIYKQTKNPYLPGIICGIIVAIISCSNTLTMIG